MTALLALRDASDEAYLAWQARWYETARPEQIPPDGDWTEYGVLAGRGYGKTRVGAEWLGREAYEDPRSLPRAVIAPTQADVRFTCFEGESGLCSVVPPECVQSYNRTDIVMTLTNGAAIRGFSAEKADRLRGPQHAGMWCLAGHSRVLMADGSLKPIAEVKTSEMVMTRAGARRVLASGLSANPAPQLTLVFGETSLTCTEDHPILTSRGWIPAGEVKIGDLTWSLSDMGALRGGNAPTDIISQTSRGATSIGKFTKTTSGRYPRAGTCITKTTTRPTTIRAIWSFFRKALTSGGTCSASSIQQSRSRPSALECWTLGIRQRATSMSAFVAGQLSPRAAWGLPSPSAPLTASKHGAATLSRGASGSARPVTSRTGRTGPTSGSAQQSAMARTRDRQSTAALESARTAATTSSQSETTTSSAGPPALAKRTLLSVERLSTRGPVYDLTVEDAHEFIAEGLVVHNCDELAAWGKDATQTWDMAQFGLRLGPLPRVMWTTTPKPVEIVRQLTAPQDGRIVVRGSTFDNRANLPASFFKALEQYEGTRLGRQELYGELIDPEETGIINRRWFRLWPSKTPLPTFEWIIMSLDTAFTERTLDKRNNADPTACSVWGVFQHEKRANLILLDCWEDHLGMPDLIRRVKREKNVAYGDDEDTALIKPLFGSAKPRTSGRKPDIILIEDKGSGISLRQMLAESGIEAYAYNPGRADKVSRLHIVSPVFAQRRVWLPESDRHAGKPRTWCEPLVAQLCTFTGEGSTKHDDHVDSTTQAIRLCLDKGLIGMLPPPKIDSKPPRRYINPYAQ